MFFSMKTGNILLFFLIYIPTSTTATLEVSWDPEMAIVQFPMLDLWKVVKEIS